MKGYLVALLAIFSVSSGTLIQPYQLTSEIINNPRYLVWETQEGLYEVEDLEDATEEPTNITLFATEDDVSFYVFTPENPVIGVQIRESDLHNIESKTGFDTRRPTLVVIHGWKNDFEAAVNDRIKNAVLKNNNINVLVVDWSPIASRNYLTAQRSVLAVGNYVGDVLLRLDEELKHKIHHVTIVGHSLGAHISGNAGARTNGLIETIIGLDPAGPLFSSSRTDNRLDSSDGKYVHVIHTNDGMLGFGINMGHVDYYPNGGSSQPGCGIDLVGSCAHSRAYEYYAESLLENHFVSQKCDTFRNFGNNLCNQNAVSLLGGYPIQEAEHGEYYLRTNNASPFALG